ncbi:LysM peptidoglycan-binding domain-containing protein [Candidatus Saccharibacteria bacterium]|nr:LysM peptidoglycan-binding domain-containing protein [Candidatus Saccharibacteria bacterium]
MRKIALSAIAFAVVMSATAVTHTATAAVTNKESKTLAQSVSEPAKDAKKPSETTRVIVKVAEGDSLSSIAEKNNTTWVRLFNANDFIQHPDIINPGQDIRVPATDEVLVERALPQPPVVVPVQTAYQAPATQGYSRPTTPTSYPVSANSAKAFIYNKESGNNPNATNPSGCYGIGQDCNGVLRTQCGADYACQDAYFESYAQRRYGSWENAYAFWQANGWW